MAELTEEKKARAIELIHDGISWVFTAMSMMDDADAEERADLFKRQFAICTQMSVYFGARLRGTFDEAVAEGVRTMDEKPWLNGPFSPPRP